MADNGVTIENTPNIIVITDSDQNQVVVTQPVVNVIEVNTPGPKGPAGAQGPSGSQGLPGDELFTELSSSLYFTTSSLQVTGSISVTGGVSGSFSGSGAGLFNIPASGITGLNLSQIASGSATASISPDSGFKVNTNSEITGSLTVTGSSNLYGPLYNVGTYWETISGSNLQSNLPWRGLAYGNGLFVAVADRNGAPVSLTGSIATSQDGVQWTFRTLPALTGLTNIIYQNGIFIAIGRISHRAFYSYNGVDWFQGTGIGGQVYGLAYGDGKFIATQIDNSGLRITLSYNGRTWSNVSTPTSMDLSWVGAAYGNGTFVAVAESTVSQSIAISYDGISWNNVQRPTDGGFTTYQITYGNGLFVVTGNQGKILTSPDGINWTIRQTPLSGLIWKITYAEGLFIAAGSFSTTENKLIYSYDGITWEEASSPSLSNWSGFAYGNGMLLSVAFNSTGSSPIRSGILKSITAPGNNITHGAQTFTDSITVSGSGRFSGNLTITGSATNSLLVKGSGTTSATTSFRVENANASASIVVLDNGNVGIGTTTDAGYKLDVNGTGRFTNNLIVTGSLTVSGSSTLTNIGPAIFSGSVSTNDVFTGSGAGLFDIPASGITGLNLSQIASGSTTASISPDLGFQVNTSASITGSLSVSGVITGSGAGITNISASSIVGLNLSQIASGSVTASVNINTDSFTLSSGSNTLFEVDNDGDLYSYGTASLKETKITGSLLVSQNLTVLGTASFTQVTSSVIIVGASTITLSTDDPVVRFGGIVVVDSGSFGTNSTGSLLWDSEEDRWIYVTPSGSAEGYNSAILIGGPPNTGSVGNESGLTAGRIMKATGDDHIGSSLMRETGSVVSVDGNFEISGSFSSSGSVFASEFTGSGLGIVNAQIGDPTDGTYSDGFFDTFTTSTKLADALDEISEAFLDLAPAKAPVLTNTNMSRTNPAVFTGYLAGGLNAQWYATASAYSQYITLTAATNIDLRATGSRAGKASDISASLIGGVTSSRAYGTAAFVTVDSRSLSSGLGSSNTIDIDFLGTFNTFWAIFSASIDDTITQTGSVQYKISADNGAGTTNPFQLFYVGGAGDFPNQSISGVTCVTSSTTFNYLSGITMLRGATFTVGFTGSDLFNPVYNLNQVSLTSSFFTTLTTGSNTPLWNDTLRLTSTRTLAATTHSGQATGTGNITVSKPNKSNVATSYTLSNSYINSYTAAQSTNNNNTQNDIFVDEAQRYTNLQTAGFASGSTLTDGNLQVQNARLIVGRWGDYGAFVSGSTSLSTSYANYFRDSIPGSTNRIAGTFSILRNASAFAASTPISAWGSGGRLEAVLVLKADITGAETANFYYDLGRAVGSNTGNIIGIRNTITTNNTTTYTVTWALPAGVNTGANGCVIWIRYRNTPNTDFIRSLTITYS